MKKQKKQMVQPDFWGNVPSKKKGKKFQKFDAERELVIRMINDAKRKDSK